MPLSSPAGTALSASMISCHAAPLLAEAEGRVSPLLERTGLSERLSDLGLAKESQPLYALAAGAVVATCLLLLLMCCMHRGCLSCMLAVPSRATRQDQSKECGGGSLGH